MLLEIGKGVDKVIVLWKRVDDKTEIGYFSPRNDPEGVYFVKVSKIPLKNEKLLLNFTFGHWDNGKENYDLTGKNKDQYIILGTIRREINKIFNEEYKNDPIALFTVKNKFDTPEGRKKREGIYNLIATWEAKEKKFTLERITTEFGVHFIISKQPISKLEIMKFLKDEDLLSLSTIKSLYKK